MKCNHNESKRNVIVIVVITLIILVIMCILLVLNNRTYTVTFNNGSKSKVVEVKKNKVVHKPATPIKNGYKFIGWYSNGVKFNFDTKITKNINLEAKYKKEKTDEVKEEGLVTTTVISKETTAVNSAKKNNVNSNTTYKKSGKSTTKKTEVSTTTTSQLTTTQKIVYGYYWVDDKNSSIGQSVLYVVNKNTNTKVSGTVTITYANGASETVSIPVSGRMFVKSTISQVSNVKGN